MITKALLDAMVLAINAWVVGLVCGYALGRWRNMKGG